MLLGGSLGGLTSARPVPHGSQAHATEKATGLEAARSRASRSIDKLFGRDAPMAKALLIADQHEIPPDVRDKYARAGMVHMLSISGLHVAIVAGAVVLLLQLIRVPRATASIASIVVTAIYVAVIGAPPPALRSAVMLATVAASKATQRPTSQWAALALGALIPLVVPRTILDLGYQLSVVGIAGLIASGSLSKRVLAPKLDGWQLKIARELMTSVIATILTAPLIAWYFGRISLIAPIANLAAGPVISLLQPTLFLALVTAPIPPLARFFAAACHPLLVAFDGVATAASGVPGASINVVPSLLTVVFGCVVVMALLVAALSRYPFRPLIAAAGATCLVAWSPLIHMPYGGGVEMDVLDVGQGDAILVRTDRGHWIIFDSGRTWQGGDAGRSTIIPLHHAPRRDGRELCAFARSCRSCRWSCLGVSSAASGDLLGFSFSAGQRRLRQRSARSASFRCRLASRTCWRFADVRRSWSTLSRSRLGVDLLALRSEFCQHYRAGRIWNESLSAGRRRRST